MRPVAVVSVSIPVAVAAVVLIALALPAVRPAAARSNAGAPVRQATSGHTITVVGHGEVSLPPDQATFTVGVTSRAEQAQSALADNGDKMNAVIAAIKAQGVPADHIKTSQLSIYRDDQNGVYVASHQLTVRLDDVNKVGPVLDASVGAGANSSWGVQFGLKDQSSARAKALQSAVSDARKQADAVAAQLGVTITGVGSAQVPTYTSTPPVYAAAPLAPGAASSTPVQPGQLTETADLSVTYTF